MCHNIIHNVSDMIWKMIRPSVSPKTKKAANKHQRTFDKVSLSVYSFTLLNVFEHAKSINP